MFAERQKSMINGFWKKIANKGALATAAPCRID